MHSSSDHEAGLRDDLFEEITVENVADNRQNRSLAAIEVIIRHPDLPEGVSSGSFYVPGPLANVFEALEAHLSEIIRDLEVGVSGSRRAALSPIGVWRPLPGEGMAFEGVVLGRWVQ